VGLGEDLQAPPSSRRAARPRHAKEQGVDFETGAAEDLVEFVAADLMRLNEIDN